MPTKIRHLLFHFIKTQRPFGPSSLFAAVALLCFSAITSPAFANIPSMGFTQLPQPDGAMMTVFYPSSGTEISVQQGPFSLSWAPNGPPVMGNRHLIVISHGSGGSPWVHTDLARAGAARLHGRDSFASARQLPRFLQPRPAELAQTA